MKENNKPKRNQPYCIRTFKCPECGNHAYASKIGAVTGNGHKKKMYCPWCTGDRNMVQVDFIKHR